MSERDSNVNEQRAERLRLFIYAAVTLEFLLWIAAVVYIGRNSGAKGDGTEWAAVVPATVILALGVAPPLALRRYPHLLWFGALLAVAGVLLMAALLFEIMRELG